MTSLIFATLLGLPVFPINPPEQDTIGYMNIHVTAGLNGPGSVISTGPELTVKYEMVISHPFILRAAYDYRYGSVNSNVYPNGDLHRNTLSAEGIYYRGTDKLTGYIGLGLVYSVNSFNISSEAGDSLYQNFGINEVDVGNAIGYRITAGLRISRSYSIEIGLTDTRPDYEYTTRFSSNRFSIAREQVRFNDFRVSFGYLFNLRL